MGRSQGRQQKIQHEVLSVREKCFVEAVELAADRQEGRSRTAGDIVYWAVGREEPAGKALADCELVAAVLPFYVPGEDDVPRGTMGDLKVRKAVRLACAAYKQGGLMSLPDLAFLLGMGVPSLKRAIARSGAFVPTRGNIGDIGPGVTHRVLIVGLYVFYRDGCSRCHRDRRVTYGR